MEAVVEPSSAVKVPTMLVEVFAAHGYSPMQLRWVGAGATCTIGRALTCDIVLDDAHAAADHTQLTLLDDGRVAIKDLGSRNGTRIDGKRLEVGTAAFIDDAILIVGRTRIRVRTLNATLPPEKVFRRDTLQRHRTALAIGGLALLLSYLAFNEWRSAPEQLARDIFVTMLIAAGLTGVWVSLWALLTRISHGIWALRTHVAIIASASGIALWSAWVFDVAQFATQWTWLTVLAGLLGSAAVLGALYLHFRKATLLSMRAAAAVAVAIPLVLGGVAGWIGAQDSARDVNRITRGPSTYPPQLRLAASIELDEYLKEANGLKRDANRKRQASLAEMPIAGPEE